MAVKLFAAITIGSTETELKIYEISKGKGAREIDCITKRIDLGVDTYQNGVLDPEKVELLVDTLKDYKHKMEGMHVDGYRMVGTSALRGLKTALIAKDYLENQTGLDLTILSNSEQRFIDYKSIASETKSFETIIESGTMIADIGGNSLQLSVFDKDKLFTTQNIRVGKITTRETFYPLAANNEHFEKLLRELMAHELSGFGKLYQKDRQIVTLIVMNRELEILFRPIIAERKNNVVTVDLFRSVYSKIVYLDPQEITQNFGISYEAAQFLVPSAIICESLIDQYGVKSIWLPEVSIGDGLCYDFALENKLIRPSHNFDEDIIAASRNIAKRYKSGSAHTKNVEELALALFDRMKKIHGLGQRERLLLQISAILHNCGKYISLTDVSDCAYNIIMATEIIGLSHAERQIVANVVRFNTSPFAYYEELSRRSSVSREEFLIIAKLTALLRSANALDRSHRQKIREIGVTVKENALLIFVTSNEDLTLEKGTLESEDALFEEVFNLRPVLKQRKKL